MKINNNPVIETVNLITDCNEKTAHIHEYFRVSCERTNWKSTFFYIEICIGYGYNACELKIMTPSGWQFFANKESAGIKSYSSCTSASKEEKIRICEETANEFKEFAANFVKAGLQF